MEVRNERAGSGPVRPRAGPPGSAAAAAATIEYGLGHGLGQINWDCQAENLGSLRTAQRLGLEPVDIYRMYCFFCKE
jgi:RimJ/RimL family protein N-acetyltransferase